MTPTTGEKQPDKTFNNVLGGLSASSFNQLWNAGALYTVYYPSRKNPFKAYFTYCWPESLPLQVSEQKLTHLKIYKKKATTE